jgi:hypothetical protein
MLRTSKIFWRSKTFWANAIAFAALVTQHFCGVEIPADVQVALLATVNLVLRAVTREAIHWPDNGALKSLLLLVAAGACLLSFSGCAGAKVATAPDGTCNAGYFSVLKSYDGIKMAACGGSGQADGVTTDQQLTDALTQALIRGLGGM